MKWYWSAREKDGAWMFSYRKGIEYVSWLVTWSRSLCRSPVRPKLPTLPAVTKTWVLWRSMVMSHKGSGFDFMDNTWTSPHSHLCQAGRAKVCRGGDQRPNTLSLKMFIFIIFNEKNETNLPMRNHQNSGQHREVQTLSSWGARLKYSTIKQPSTIQRTINIHEKK